MKTTVYTPDSSLAHPFTMLRDMGADLLASRELAWRLTVRDISAQYRQSFLGLLWAIILPVATTLVWLYLNLSGIVQVRATDIPYAVYAFSGTMLWAIFIEAMNAPLAQTNGARGMLCKLSFPREALILSGIYKNLFNAGIKIVLLLAVLPFFQIHPGWGLLWFPLGVLALVLAGTAIGLFITPVGLLYTDVGRGLPLIMSFVMYLTPVVFPMPEGDGFTAHLFHLNPLTPLILNGRAWLTGGEPLMLGYFAAVIGASVALLLVSWIGYRLTLPIIIERMAA